MAFAGRWDVSNAVEFEPEVRYRVIRPYVVKPLKTVCATKAVKS
jgi:hypothetical protein